MNMFEFATKYELNEAMATDPVVYFVQVFAILTKIAKTLTATTERKSTGVEKAISIISEDTSTVAATEDLATSLRLAIFTALDGNEEVSILLPKILDEIRREVVEVRNLAMRGIELPADDDEDQDEDDEDTEALRAEVVNAVRILKEQPATLLAMHGKSFGDLPTDMVGTRKNGEQYVKLPKGFSEDALTKSAEAGKGVGRPLATANWTFTLDGNALPVVPLEVLAIRYCSSPTSRVSAGELREWYKNRTGEDFPKPDDSKTVTIPVPKGTLVGTFTSK